MEDAASDGSGFKRMGTQAYSDSSSFKNVGPEADSTVSLTGLGSNAKELTNRNEQPADDGSSDSSQMKMGGDGNGSENSSNLGKIIHPSRVSKPAPLANDAVKSPTNKAT